MAFINLKQLWSCANELSRIANLVFVISLQFFQQQKSASLAIRVKDQQLCTKRPERDIFGLLARPPSRRISRCTIVVDDHLRRRRRHHHSQEIMKRSVHIITLPLSLFHTYTHSIYELFLLYFFIYLLLSIHQVRISILFLNSVWLDLAQFCQLGYILTDIGKYWRVL